MWRSLAQLGWRRAADRFWCSPPALMVVASLFWALNPIVGRAARDAISPISLAFWRWTVALAVLLPFALRHIAADLPVIRRSWRALTGLGVIGVGAFSYLVYWSLQHTTATNNLLLQSVMPALMLVLPALLYGDRISLRGVACAILSMAGVAWIVTKGDPRDFAWGEINIGDVAALIAVGLYAVYGTLLRRAPHMHHLSLLAVLFAVGMLFLGGPYAMKLAATVSIAVPPMEAVLAAAYVGIFPSLIAYALFNRTVALVGIANAGLYLNLPTVLGVAIAVPLLGEAFEAYHLIGACLVFVAIVFASRRSSPARAS